MEKEDHRIWSLRHKFFQIPSDSMNLLSAQVQNL